MQRKESSNPTMQENKLVLEFKNTEEKVYQKLKWKKKIFFNAPYYAHLCCKKSQHTYMIWARHIFAFLRPNAIVHTMLMYGGIMYIVQCWCRGYYVYGNKWLVMYIICSLSNGIWRPDSSLYANALLHRHKLLTLV